MRIEKVYNNNVVLAKGMREKKLSSWGEDLVFKRNQVTRLILL